MPNQARRKSSENPSAILPTGRPLVLVVMIVPGLRMASTFFNNARLISRFSTTASMIQSTSASFFRSSSKLPTVTKRASDGSMNAAGLDFLAASSPAAAILFRAGPSASGGTISKQVAGNAGIGEMRGDAGAHGSGAEDGDFIDALHDIEPRNESLNVLEF